MFPGLLPFLVLSELMLAFGAVHALSSLLDPVMRRGAGMPGTAAWPVALGWTAGYTAGAEATASLRKQQAVSRREGQWLLAVSYMPNPMFMFIVIGAGFFSSSVSRRLHRSCRMAVRHYEWSAAAPASSWNQGTG